MVVLLRLTALIVTFCGYEAVAYIRPPQRPRGGGSWCRTYRMLKFVVGFVELDSSMLGGSNVDPVVQFGSTLANNYNGRPII